jgi:hypothetical protein
LEDTLAESSNQTISEETAPVSVRIFTSRKPRASCGAVICSLIAALGKGGKRRSGGFKALLYLHRFAESITLATHLKGVAMVAESIEQGSGHPFALEDLRSLAERDFARIENTPMFVAAAEDAKDI